MTGSSSFPLGAVTPTSIIALLGTFADAGIFHRITMTGMTGAWFMKLTNFEAIVIGIIILEIFVMRYLQILPLDFTKLIEKGVLLQSVVSKKKRKRRGVPEEDSAKLLEGMLMAVRRLDEEDCLLKSLCEMEFASDKDIIPPQILRILTVIKRMDPSSFIPDDKSSNMTSSRHDKPAILQLKDAVLTGSCQKVPSLLKESVQTSWKNESNCVDVDIDKEICSCNHSFPLCKLDGSEILSLLEDSYFSIIS